MFLEVNESEFRKIIKNGQIPVIAYFHAEWCNPCKTMSPEFEAVAKELEAAYKFIKISIDVAPKLASEYKVIIIPTIVFIKNSKTVGHHSGQMKKKAIKKQIELLLQ
jgi:thioredoxin 1/putative thioredoxin